MHCSAKGSASAKLVHPDGGCAGKEGSSVWNQVGLLAFMWGLSICGTAKLMQSTGRLCNAQTGNAWHFQCVSEQVRLVTVPGSLSASMRSSVQAGFATGEAATAGAESAGEDAAWGLGQGSCCRLVGWCHMPE